MGDIPTNVYTQQSKKNFIFVMLGESVFMLVMFAYFLCVTAAYSEDMHGPAEEEAAPVEEAKADDAKSNKSGKSGKSGKSNKSAAKSDKPKSAKGDEAGAGDAAPAEG